MTRALIVGDGRDDVARRLAEMGRTVAAVESLSATDIDASDVVVLLTDGPLPREAVDVLKAGRVLVTTASGPYRGLQPGVEFLRADGIDSAVEQANMALIHPDALRIMRAVGRVVAQRSFGR